MKALINKSLMLASLIILTVFTITSSISADWCNTIFIWQLLLLSVVICALQLLTNLIKSNYYLVELLVEYAMVVCTVFSFGLICGWFDFSCILLVFIYVTPVYLVAYLLNIVRSKCDADYINEKIKQREKRLKNESTDDSNAQSL